MLINENPLGRGIRSRNRSPVIRFYFHFEENAATDNEIWVRVAKRLTSRVVPEKETGSVRITKDEPGCSRCPREGFAADRKLRRR